MAQKISVINIHWKITDHSCGVQLFWTEKLLNPELGYLEHYAGQWSYLACGLTPYYYDTVLQFGP